MLGRSSAGRSARRSHWRLGLLPGPQSGRYGRSILRDARALVVLPCLALFWRSMLLQFPKHVVMIVVGCQLHMQLAPYDDHDDVLRELEQHRSPEQRQTWEDYQRARVAKDRATVSAALRARKQTKAPV